MNLSISCDTDCLSVMLVSQNLSHEYLHSYFMLLDVPFYPHNVITSLNHAPLQKKKKHSIIEYAL